MWLEALDLVLGRLKESVDLGQIKGISGSCQQHGSVYWARGAGEQLKGLSAEKELVEQLKDAFSHPFAPNWQDHSTSAECEQFNAKLGGPEKLADITGSGAHHVGLLPPWCHSRNSWKSCDGNDLRFY
jgi:xylulokinase